MLIYRSLTYSLTKYLKHFQRGRWQLEHIKYTSSALKQNSSVTLTYQHAVMDDTCMQNKGIMQFLPSKRTRLHLELWTNVLSTLKSAIFGIASILQLALK